MVRMENIERNGNKISLDCYEEGDSARVHHVEFDADTLEITNQAVNNMYVKQSIAKIWKFLHEKAELPRSASSYWY